MSETLPQHDLEVAPTTFALRLFTESPVGFGVVAGAVVAVVPFVPLLTDAGARNRCAASTNRKIVNAASAPALMSSTRTSQVRAPSSLWIQ